MPQFSQPTRHDHKKTFFLLVVYIAAITAGAIALIPINEPYGFIAWLIIVLGGLLLLVGWVNRHFGYRCRSCGHDFEISLFVNLVSPHGMGWKYLKCPDCGRRTRAKVLRKK